MEGCGAKVIGGVDPGPTLNQESGNRQGGEQVAHGAPVFKEVLSLERIGFRDGKVKQGITGSCAGIHLVNKTVNFLSEWKFKNRNTFKFSDKEQEVADDLENFVPRLLLLLINRSNLKE